MNILKEKISRFISRWGKEGIKRSLERKKNRLRQKELAKKVIHQHPETFLRNSSLSARLATHGYAIPFVPQKPNPTIRPTYQTILIELEATSHAEPSGLVRLNSKSSGLQAHSKFPKEAYKNKFKIAEHYGASGYIVPLFHDHQAILGSQNVIDALDQKVEINFCVRIKNLGTNEEPDDSVTEEILRIASDRRYLTINGRKPVFVDTDLINNDKIRADGIELIKDQSSKISIGQMQDRSISGALTDFYEKLLDNMRSSQLATQEKNRNSILICSPWAPNSKSIGLAPEQHAGYSALHALGAAIENTHFEPELQARVDQQNSRFKKTSDTCIALHLYYEDLIDELVINLIKPIRTQADLFISIKPSTKVESIEKIIEAVPNTFFFVVENRGRDVRPFLIAIQKIHELNYLYCCKIHTKKSPQFIDGDQTRNALIGELIGTEDIFKKNLNHLKSNKNISIIAPKKSLTSLAHPDIHGGNKKWLDKKLRELDRADLIGSYAFEFPAGTMFWMSVPLMSKLAESKKFPLDAFEVELGQLDGTFAHAVERLIGLIATEGKHRMIENH